MKEEQIYESNKQFRDICKHNFKKVSNKGHRDESEQGMNCMTDKPWWILVYSWHSWSPNKKSLSWDCEQVVSIVKENQNGIIHKRLIVAK